MLHNVYAFVGGYKEEEEEERRKRRRLKSEQAGWNKKLEG